MPWNYISVWYLKLPCLTKYIHWKYLCTSTELSLNFLFFLFFSLPGLPFPSPGDLPNSGIESMSPAVPMDSLPLSHPRSPFATFSSVQLLSRVWLFATPWTATQQASLSITNDWNLLRLMSIASVIHPTISFSVTPFSFCLQSFPSEGFFKWVTSLHQVAKVLEFQLQHQSFQWIFRNDFL